MYPTEIITALISKLPLGVYFSDKAAVSEDNFYAAVRSAFPDASDSHVKSECRKIWEIIYGNNQSQFIDNDDTPDFVLVNNVLVIKKSFTEFYPFKYLFVRDCYKQLYPKLIQTAKNTVVALIGDPGIGKSSFLRYVFANIVGNRKGPVKKVFWIMESGFWRYFDGKNRFSGKGDSDFWVNPEVLLLIDGSFRNEHLHRTKNVILFSSPQQQNYDKIIKANSGAIFVMPPWNLTEVKTFIDIEIDVTDSNNNGNRGIVVKKNILCELMKVFYERLSVTAQIEDVQQLNSDVESENSEEGDGEGEEGKLIFYLLFI